LSHVHYSYAYDSECLKLHTLRKKRYHFQTLFLVHFYLHSTFSPFILEAVGLWVHTWYIREIYTFNFCSSVICASDVNDFIVTYFEPKLFLLIKFYNGTLNY
jgi:hypothetical protein